ncbi:MAG TPA: HD family phosphohydrolase [Clostridiaceae bacterium]|nr:HD family phosphohydrolase [Clostridiaceae bacterium]
MTQKEEGHLAHLLSLLLKKEVLIEMKKYIQHGDTTTYDHVLAVARAAFKLSKKLPFGVSEMSLLKGALLHDFYLYDWHEQDPQRKRFHGLHHHRTAHKNACRHFHLTPLEEDIILRHMWPLTLKMPRSREGWLVCVADKWVSLEDTFRRTERKNT